MAESRQEGARRPFEQKTTWELRKEEDGEETVVAEIEALSEGTPREAELLEVHFSNHSRIVRPENLGAVIKEVLGR